MKKYQFLISIFMVMLIGMVFFACEKEKTDVLAEKVQLWNGKDFTGWKKFVPDETVDVDTVWTVTDGVIRCNGKPAGYIRTEGDYSNYKLHLDGDGRTRVATAVCYYT